MVLVVCKNKCSFVKELIRNLDDPEERSCEILFHLVKGTETFCTPDGRVQQSAYFDIEADSEEEKAQKMKCLRKQYGEEKLTVFENIPGTNPIVEWELTNELQMKLATCVQELKNDTELFMEIFEPVCKDFSVNRDPLDDIDEVWNRFISHRLSLSECCTSTEDINYNAVEWTLEDIYDISNENNIDVFRNIVNEIKRKEIEEEE
jgi:hypothetical protein